MENVELSVPIAGLGVDIVEIGRIEKILKRSPAFKARVYTEGERAYCDAHPRPHVRYATHFAAKEAVLKALGTGFSQGIRPTDVEVTHNEKGRPLAVLHGAAAQIAQEQGILEMHISLSRTQGTAVANAIAATEATKPAPPEETVTSKQAIASAFKELRGMLDELDALEAAQLDDDDIREDASGDEADDAGDTEPQEGLDESNAEDDAGGAIESGDMQ